MSSITVQLAPWSETKMVKRFGKGGVVKPASANKTMLRAAFSDDDLAAVTEFRCLSLEHDGQYLTIREAWQYGYDMLEVRLANAVALIVLHEKPAQSTIGKTATYKIAGIVR